MFAIEVQSSFHASHALRLADGTTEPLHAHDFHVTIRLTARQLDPLDTVLDFHELQAYLDTILAPWKNRSLNDLEPFQSNVNPSAERIAEHIGLRLSDLLSRRDSPTPRPVRLVEVRITEAPGCLAIWTPP